MKNTLALAPRISFARLTSRQSDTWLDVFAVAAFTLSTLMALTVGGGIWMFHQYHLLFGDELLNEVPSRMALYSETFLIFAWLAGALLVIPIFSLGGSAARLGARGRTVRLASLRLIGMTSPQTVVLALVESISQWLVGTVVGTLLYYLTLPCWSAVSFFQRPIDPSMMRLPLHFIALIIALLFVIAIISTVAGLSRVRISPLGVTRREETPGLKLWRPVVFFVMVIVFFAWATGHTIQVSEKSLLITMGILVFFVIFSVMIAGSWLLQLVVRPFTRFSSPAVLLASRRILDDPRSAWRPIASLAIISLIGGFLSSIPAASPEDIWLLQDVYTGAIITLGFGFVISALSTLMNQATAVFDRADQTLALRSMSTPKGLFSTTRLIQVLGPLTLTTVLSAFLGLQMSHVVSADMPYAADGSMRIFWILGVGIGLCCVSLLLCEPLERNVLGSRGRKND